MVCEPAQKRFSRPLEATRQAVFAWFGRTMQRSLDRVYEACAADFKCTFMRRSLREELSVAAATLDAKPIIIGLVGAGNVTDSNIPFTGDMLPLSLRRMLMNDELWVRVPDGIHRTPKDEAFAIASGIYGTLPLESSQAQGLYWSVTCAEDAPRMRRESIVAATAGTPVRAELIGRFLTICARWPAATVPEDFYSPVVSPKPALVLSGGDDPITPPEFGSEVARTLTNSRHLVFEYSSHTPFTSCQQAIVNQFILAAATQPLDTTCMAAQKRPEFKYHRPWFHPF